MTQMDLFTKSEIETQIKKTDSYQEGRGAINWEIEIDI